MQPSKGSPVLARFLVRRRDFLLGAVATSVLVTQARAQGVSDDEARNILQDHIDRARQSVGIVAVSFDSDREKITTYGRGGATNDRPLDGDTVFEIGSITKVFTAL